MRDPVDNHPPESAPSVETLALLAFLESLRLADDDLADPKVSSAAWR
jgi:hypothetical protein